MKKLIIVLIALLPLSAMAQSEFEESRILDCFETWSKVYGPSARPGASWNSEWGWAAENDCVQYFDEFDQQIAIWEREQKRKGQGI